MAAITVRLDRAGVAKVLKSAGVQRAVHRVAEKIADDVRSQKPDAAEVVVDDYTTDRAASSVTIKDARGRVWQARDGVLTRAAGRQGLDVTARKS
jgi:hypothetical protein